MLKSHKLPYFYVLLHLILSKCKDRSNFKDVQIFLNELHLRHLIQKTGEFL